MVEQVHALDWARTALGPREAWPQSLRTLADLALANPVPTALLWGPELIQIYNDAWRALMADKQPTGLGLPAHACFPEIRDVMAPLYERAWRGEAQVLRDALLPINRRGAAQDAWWTAQCVPARDESGAVAGLFCTLTETTGEVLAGQKRTGVADAARRSEADARESAASLAGQTEAFQAALDGAGLEQSLEVLVRTACAWGGAGTRAAFYLADPDGTHLVRVAGMPEFADLPGEYMVIGPKVPGSGLAAFMGQPVIAPDVAREPSWATRLWLAERHGFRAVWSFPVDSSGGRPMGAFSLYFDAPREATERELSFLSSLARAAAIVISRHGELEERTRAEAALRASEERLRQFGEASQDVLWIRDADTLQWQYLTAGFEAIYGLSREEALTGNNYRSWLDLIVPEDRESAMAAISRVRAGAPAAYEIRIKRPTDGGIRWLRSTDFPIRDASGRVGLIGGIGSDITEQRQAELRWQALVEGMPQMVWRAVEGGHWTWASPQWTTVTGQAERESHGLGWLETVHPDDRQRVMQAWSLAVEQGSYQADYRVMNKDEDRYRWLQTRATPVRDDRGTLVEWLGTSTDVDDLRSLQQRQQVLVAELQHRVRNILAVVRSVFGRTVETGGDLEDVADHFKGRLDALARTQVIVTQSASGLVDLEDLIRDELLSVGVGDGPSLTLSGPTVSLPAKHAESIALAIHELTTNALKYGALRGSGGHLVISWIINVHQSGARKLDLTWTEQGVPAVPLRPSRQGFGSDLIKEALPYRLGAQTALIFRGGGIQCTICVPLPAEGGTATPAWKGL